MDAPSDTDWNALRTVAGAAADACDLVRIYPVGLIPKHAHKIQARKFSATYDFETCSL